MDQGNSGRQINITDQEVQPDFLQSQKLSSICHQQKVDFEIYKLMPVPGGGKDLKDYQAYRHRVE